LVKVSPPLHIEIYSQLGDQTSTMIEIPLKHLFLL
jgi:hypothetical protein